MHDLKTFAIKSMLGQPCYWMEKSSEAYINDAQALKALKRKEASGLRALLSKYESPLIGYLTSITSDHALAEDLTQETFLKLIKRPPFKLANGSIKPWLFQVGRNLAIDQLRHRQRIELRDTLPEKNDLPHNTTHEILDPSDTQMLLQSLPEDMRQIVALRIYGDFTFKEISKQLKIPLGTVLWKMSKAVDQMRKTLEAENHEKA